MNTPPESMTINWEKQFRFLHIFKSFRQSFSFGKILLAAVGIILSAVVLLLLHWIWLFSGFGIKPEVLVKSPMIIKKPLDEKSEIMTPAHVFYTHEGHCLYETLKASRKLMFFSRAGDIWNDLNSWGGYKLQPSVDKGYGALAMIIAAVAGLKWLMFNYWFFTIVLGLSLLIVWSFIGGAICRISAVQFARDEVIPYRSALQFSRAKFKEFILAPVIPVVVIIILGLLLLLGGWFLRIPVIGSIVGPVIYSLALMSGAIIAGLAIVLAIGFSLMWPTVAVEGLDCTDAISRGPGYIGDKPAHAIWYFLTALWFGSLAWLLIRVFAFLLLYSTHGFVDKSYPDLNNMLAAPTLDQLYDHTSTVDKIEGFDGGIRRTWSTWVVRFWSALVVLVVYGYLVSYFFTSSTIIYYLLRNAVDETEYDEVYLESSDDETASELSSTSATPATAPNQFIQLGVPPSSNPPPEGSTGTS